VLLHQGENYLSLTTQEIREEVRNLINVGKERGYLLSDEVDHVLPAGVHSSEEIDDLLSTFERIGISIYEDLAAAKAAHATPDTLVSETPAVEWSDRFPVVEESELDLTPGTLDKHNDPVRLYLREMGLVPLLKRHDEVAIAQRMERGHRMVLKAISRSPIVLKELIAVGEELRHGTQSIKKIIHFEQEELTEQETENKTRDILRIIERIEQLYKVALKQAARFRRTSRANKRTYLRHRNRLARTHF
jgi:RNA polymerase primary sigma factor